MNSIVLTQEVPVLHCEQRENKDSLSNLSFDLSSAREHSKWLPRVVRETVFLVRLMAHTAWWSEGLDIRSHTHTWGMSESFTSMQWGWSSWPPLLLPGQPICPSHKCQFSVPLVSTIVTMASVMVSRILLAFIVAGSMGLWLSCYNACLTFRKAWVQYPACHKTWHRRLGRWLR